MATLFDIYAQIVHPFSFPDRFIGWQIFLCTLGKPTTSSQALDWVRDLDKWIIKIGMIYSTYGPQNRDYVQFYFRLPPPPRSIDS